jgi:hypothetical protein
MAHRILAASNASHPSFRFVPISDHLEPVPDDTTPKLALFPHLILSIQLFVSLFSLDGPFSSISISPNGAKHSVRQLPSLMQSILTALLSKAETASFHLETS